MTRNTKQPIFAQDEEIILYSQGGFKNPMTSGWKLGHHYLTNQRLLFFQPTGMTFEIPISRIFNITVERHKFVLKAKEVICLSYHHARNGRTSKLWIIMNNLEAWRRKIREMTVIDKEAVERVAREVDDSCCEILWYLWEHKHAPVDELVELIGAQNHMDVLLKIKNIINPVAERVVGSPILEFERARIDYETGENVLSCWWLVGQKQQLSQSKEAMVDIFDEGDHLKVVIELTSVREEDIRLVVKENRLDILVNASDKEYHKEVPLPVPVNTQGFSTKYHNNILEVRLEKEREGVLDGTKS